MDGQLEKADVEPTFLAASRTAPQADYLEGARPLRRRPMSSQIDYRTETARVSELEAILRDVPAGLTCSRGSASGLVGALQSHDRATGSDLARRLLLLAAVVHLRADERRTAEYLLRNRDRITHREGEGAQLLRAARCAVEMDVRRVSWLETPTSTLAHRPEAAAPASIGTDSPSPADLVLAIIARVLGPLSLALTERIVDGVVVALELAEQHHRNGGRNPSVLAMRSDGRPDARLVTHLRAEFDSRELAAYLARLLVGPDGTAVDSALLWWAAQPSENPVPDVVRARWQRYLKGSERVLCASLAVQLSTSKQKQA